MKPLFLEKNHWIIFSTVSFKTVIQLCVHLQLHNVCFTSFAIILIVGTNMDKVTGIFCM